ncbi:hypothetical protein [Arthrobacter sp. KBS0703]|nr:hypothetical protein [Arthrobacter sp. KBS0703]
MSAAALSGNALVSGNAALSGNAPVGRRALLKFAGLAGCLLYTSRCV